MLDNNLYVLIYNIYIYIYIYTYNITMKIMIFVLILLQHFPFVAQRNQPVLWLEALNKDFRAQVDVGLAICWEADLPWCFVGQRFETLRFLEDLYFARK